MSASRWTAADIPVQGGRTVVVTGADGIGLAGTRAPARAGVRFPVARAAS